MKVLVIDDDEIARELILSILSDGGHQTFDLPSPIGATQIILDQRIDVVVLDLLMPALSGDKLVRMLRSNPRLTGLLIVLVSGDSDQLRHLAATVKVDAVVSKADLRSELLLAVSSARLATN